MSSSVLPSVISPVHWKIARGAHLVFPRDGVWPQNGRLVSEQHLSGGDAASGRQAPAAVIANVIYDGESIGCFAGALDCIIADI